LLNGGPDILVSITMFDKAEEALASSEAAAEWVRDNVLEFTKGMPEVTVGNGNRGKSVGAAVAQA
jgi:hypothetical protein